MGRFICLLGISATLLIGLGFCYQRVIQLEKQNVVLQESVQQIGDAFKDEVARGEKISAITERLEQQDNERQQQFRQFSRSLATLKTTDAEMRRVLSTIVPRAALAGLRSFGAQSATGDGGESSNPLDGPLDIQRQH